MGENRPVSIHQSNGLNVCGGGQALNPQFPHTKLDQVKSPKEKRGLREAVANMHRKGVTNTSFTHIIIPQCPPGKYKCAHLLGCGLAHALALGLLPLKRTRNGGMKVRHMGKQIESKMGSVEATQELHHSRRQWPPHPENPMQTRIKSHIRLVYPTTGPHRKSKPHCLPSHLVARSIQAQTGGILTYQLKSVPCIQNTL